ncbi:hypothetical protein HBH95_122440 [Parastagonospora nodorum]|nr:hypothetical protein HBH95_122440 [Parastagonospora nodorum]
MSQSQTSISLKRSATTATGKETRPNKRPRPMISPTQELDGELTNDPLLNSLGPGGLCKPCAALQLDQATIEERGGKYMNSIHLYTFKKIDERCRFCRLLAKTIEEYNILPSRFYSNYKLVAKRAEGVREFLYELSGNGSGWLLPMPEHLPDMPPVQRPYLENEQTRNVDWWILRQWLSCCEKEHTTTCESALSVSLSGFAVIDCLTRKVVTAPPYCRFAALSYVWGAEAVPEVLSNIPTPAPPLIEDAMTCTRALGLQYLWIDRYCIDQKAKTKKTLIHNMDRIYTGAAVTIINAVGEGSSCGLPGVSYVPRHRHPSVKVGKRRVAILPNTIMEIKQSKWSRRAWTFQEGLLSRRRLVFTSSQVYFQCQETYHWEMIETRAFSCRRINLSQWASEGLEATLQPKTCLFPIMNFRSDASRLNALIEEYLRRDISYDSDILNAILGILRSVCSHIWGLTWSAETKDALSEKHDLLEALLWQPRYDPNSIITKRKGFPSWSWAAFKGITGLDQGSIDQKNTLLPHEPPVDVSIQDLNGHKYSVYEYTQAMQKNYDIYQFKPSLFLTGWILPVKLRAYAVQWTPKLSPGQPMDLLVLDSSLSRLIGIATIMTAVLEHSITDLKTVFDQDWLMLSFQDHENRNFAPGLLLKPMSPTSGERLGVVRPPTRKMRRIFESLSVSPAPLCSKACTIELV